MSILPKGWATSELSAITQPFETIDPSRQPDRIFRYVDIGSIDNKSQCIAEPKEVKGADAPSRARRVVKSGDTLFSTVRTYLKNVAIVPRELDGELTSTGIAVLRPNSAILPEYLFAVARSEAFISKISVSQDGTMYPAVSDADVTSASILLPPLPEQRRIIAKIDSLSEKSKRARDRLDHVPRLVEKYKQAILGAAFRGGLTRHWRYEHRRLGTAETTRRHLQDERDALRRSRGIRTKGKNRSLPGRDNVLPELPETWTWATFEDSAWDLTVGHVGPMKDRYVQQGIPFLRNLNVRANRIDLGTLAFIDDRFHQELAKSQLSPGDLVVVRTGDPGVAAVVPNLLTNANCADLVIARLIDSVDPHFAAYYMNSHFAKAIVDDVQVGVAQQHFNVGAMSEMPLPITSLDEQREVVRRIETAFAWINRLAFEATSARKLIDRLDQAILSKAFRGELVPQDPNDEPASVLLERTSEERAGKSGGRQRRGRVHANAERLL